MTTVEFRFYSELNDFLPPQVRHANFTYPVKPPVSVKHLIEAAGVPHTEVDLILAGGRPVSFHYLVRRAVRLAVYPQFTGLNSVTSSPLRPPLPAPPRFVLDGHLGRLARYLRLMGIDTLYYDDASNEQLAMLSHEQNRVLVSRDRGLLKRALVTYGCCLTTREPMAQLRRVIRRYQLQPHFRPWRRCLRCNGLLEPVDKSTILDRLEPKTRLYYQDFHRCQNCHNIYWRGSHHEPLAQFMARLEAETSSSG